MRITGLSMDGFGVFNGVTLTELPAGLVLVLGDNEAGKSTALGFIHTVLFGYPDGRSKSEKEYPPLNGGSPGGRLMLHTDAYGAITVERKKGPRGGNVSLTYADGETGGANALEKILGGTNRKLYRTLYGFSLAELQTIDTLTNEDVRDVIYGASLGTGFRTLPEARKRLDRRMGGLFKPGGSKPRMNQCFKDLEETRKELRCAQRGIADYEKAARSIVALTTEIQETREGITGARQRRAHVQALLQLWDDWVALQKAEADLAALEDRAEDFPDNGLARLADLNQTIAREGEKLQSAEDDLKAKRRKLEGLAFDEGLLGQGAEIADLNQGLETYEKAGQAIPIAQASVAEHKARVATVLTEIGASWNEQRALALDRSAHVKEVIFGHKSALDRAEREFTALSVALENNSATLGGAEEEEKAAKEKLEELEGAGLDVDRGVLEKLRNGRDQFSSVLADLPEREAEYKAAGEAFTRTLREIHPDWTADTLDKLDVSLPAQQRIEQFESDLQEADAAVRDAKAALGNKSSAVETIERTLGEKRTALETAGGEVGEASDLEARRSQARQLHHAVQRRTTMETELEHKEQLLDMALAEPESAAGPYGRKLLSSIASGLGGLGGLVMLVAVILFGLDQKMAAGVSAGLAVILGLGLLGLLGLRNRLSVTPALRSRPGPAATELKSRLEQLSEQRDELTPEIDKLRGELGASGALNLADAERLADEADAQLLQAGPRLRLAESINELALQLEQAKDYLAGGEKALEADRKTLSSIKKEWEEHARSLHLPTDTSPRTAGLVFAKAEKARSDRHQLGGLSTRIDGMKSLRIGYLVTMAEVPRLKEVETKKDDVILAALTTFLAEMEQQESRRREFERAGTALDDARGRSSTAAEKRRQAESDLAEARKVQEAAESAWEEWLDNHDMDADWSPGTAEHALDRAIRLAEIAGDRSSAQGDATRLQEEAGEYRQRAATVFKELGRPVPRGDQLPVEIRRLEQDRTSHDTNRALHTQLAPDIPEAETRCESRRKRIKQAEGERDELIKAGGAKDEERFRRRGEAHEQVGTLTVEIAARETSLRKLSGTADLDALKTELAGESRDHLTAEEADLENEIQAAEPRRAEAHEKLGAAEKHQQTLYSDDRVAQLRAREEGLLEDLEVDARDWARHAVANHLLDAAKERHAQANQPKVIQAAGQYFETITGSRYTKVFAPPGENTMKVIDLEGRSKAADDLSRGSMEQLYLAIRFGYITTEAAGSERLPILMDDVLVNFDPKRTAAAAAAILQLAQTRQILFFTCHPELVKIFRKQNADVPIYQIAEADIERQP